MNFLINLFERVLKIIEITLSTNFNDLYSKNPSQYKEEVKCQYISECVNSCGKEEVKNIIIKFNNEILLNKFENIEETTHFTILNIIFSIKYPGWKKEEINFK